MLLLTSAMIRSLGISALTALLACQTVAPRGGPSNKTSIDARPRILLAHDSERERETRAQLERIFDRFDLSPWFFTDTLQIDDDAIPHSDPVLTLHTRHLRDDLLLLSTYVHEQSHRYFDRHPEQTAAAMAELEVAFPDLPVGFPDGANDRESSYLHLLVIAFEQNALRQLVGELQAREVMEFWASDHYRALYRLVLSQGGSKIRPVLKAHQLEFPRLD